MITTPMALHAPTLPSEPRLRHHVDEVHERGYTVIHGFLDRETASALRAYCDAHMPPIVPADRPSAHRRPELRPPLPNPGFVAGLITDELVALATALLDATDLRLVCQNFCRTDPMPGPPGAQGYHIDRVMFPCHRQARPRQVYHHLFQALSDVRSGGGAFTVVPGSHHAIWAAAERFQGRAMSDYRELGREVMAAAGVDESAGVEVLAQDGDLIVFDPMCVHSASANTRRESRYIVNHAFYDASSADLEALWEATHERAHFSEELRRALPAGKRRLLLRGAS
jgi:hypothetical protein